MSLPAGDDHGPVFQSNRHISHGGVSSGITVLRHDLVRPFTRLRGLVHAVRPVIAGARAINCDALLTIRQRDRFVCNAAGQQQ